jgi:hypothetical protein
VRKRKKGELPRMILDRQMCLRVAEGDEDFALPTQPYHCPVCSVRPDKFSGKLRFQGREVPVCEDHDPPVLMV